MNIMKAVFKIPAITLRCSENCFSLTKQEIYFAFAGNDSFYNFCFLIITGSEYFFPHRMPSICLDV